MASPIIRYFDHKHLKEASPAQQVSSVVSNHARYLDAVLPDGPEKSAGLRKLLEAKDCFVRQALELPEGFVLPDSTTLEA